MLILIIIGYIVLGAMTVLAGVVWFDIDEDRDGSEAIFFLIWPFIWIAVILLMPCYLAYDIGKETKERRMK